MNIYHQTRSNRRSRKAGITVIEVTVTMILLGVLMSMIVPLLGTVNKQQREAERRVIAVQLIDNMMERLTAGGYDTVTRTAAAQLELPARDASFLPGAKLDVSVDEAGDEPAAKKITIALAWNDSDGAAVSPARLTGFVYQTGRQP